MTTATAQTKTYDVRIVSQDWETLEDTFQGHPIWGKDRLDRVMEVTTDDINKWLECYNQSDNTTHPEIGKVHWSLQEYYEVKPDFVCSEF